MTDRGKGADSGLRYKAIAEIIAKYGTLSSRRISKILQDEYGIVISHATVADDLKKDLATLSKTEINNKKSNILKSIETLANTAYGIAIGSKDDKVRLQAMDTYNRIVKTQAAVLKTFEEVKMKMQEIEKPIYNVFIGKPKEADLSKILKEEEDDRKSKINNPTKTD